MSNNFFKAIDGFDFVGNIKRNQQESNSHRNSFIDKESEGMDIDDFTKSYPTEDFIHLDENQFTAYKADLAKAIAEADDELEKALKVNGKTVKTYVQEGDKSYSITHDNGDESNIKVSHDDWDTINDHHQSVLKNNKLTKADLIEKAKLDLTHLKKVSVIDKKGHRETKYVKPKEFNPNSSIMSGKASKEDIGHIADKHYDSLSHINKIRFERDYEKHFGKKFDKQTTYGKGTEEQRISQRNPNDNTKKLAKIASDNVDRELSKEDASIKNFVTKPVSIPKEVVDSNNKKREEKKSIHPKIKEEWDSMSKLDRNKLMSFVTDRVHSIDKNTPKQDIISHVLSNKYGRDLSRHPSDNYGQTRKHPTQEPTTEEWKASKKPEKEVENIAPKTLSEHKKGDSVYRLMKRYNPQLGTYNVFEKKQIIRSTPKSISLDDNRVYSKEHGGAKPTKNSGSSYGTADYSIHTEEEAKHLHDEMKKNGHSVRGFNVEHNNVKKAIDFNVGDKIKFHPHESIKNSSDGSGAGYAKHMGEITHKHPDGSYDVMNDKDFISRNHPKKNNFEHLKQSMIVAKNEKIAKERPPVVGKVGNNPKDQSKYAKMVEQSEARRTIQNRMRSKLDERGEDYKNQKLR
jgi:hypothetical protein